MAIHSTQCNIELFLFPKKSPSGVTISAAPTAAENIVFAARGMNCKLTRRLRTAANVPCANEENEIYRLLLLMSLEPAAAASAERRTNRPRSQHQASAERRTLQRRLGCTYDGDCSRRQNSRSSSSGGGSSRKSLSS